MIKDDRSRVHSDVADKQLSPKDRLNVLRQQEWSICNSQCPVCRGVNEAWHGHPLYTDSKLIGHSAECHLAADIKDLGETPLYRGTYKSSNKLETYWKTFIDLQDLDHHTALNKVAQY